MVKLGDWISEGFNMLKEQFWAWVLVTLVFFLVSMLVYTCIGYFLVIGILFFGPHAIAINQLRGGEVRVGDMFSAFKLILPGLAFLLFIFVIAIPSLLLFMLPMLFIMPLFMFVPHLIVDRKLGFMDALKQSYAVVKQDYWWFVLTNFVIGFLAGLGSYVCYVGLLASLPLYWTIQAVAYRDCFGVEGARSFKSPTAPPPAA